MKIKVSEASGPVLDWMVAKCEGELGEITQASNLATLCKERNGVAFTHGRTYSPSTDWSQGGPIIEREKISIRQWTNVPIVHAYMPDGEWSSDGQSPLIAAMRCYVASRLSEEVEVPDELA